MANRQRAEARRKAAAKAARGEGAGGKGLLWAGLGVVVVIAIIIAVVAMGGDDDKGNATDGTGGTETTSGVSFPDSQPVTVTGDSLPAYDPQASADEGLGATAPVIEGLDFQGDAITLDAADGAYMVVFLAHWCPHCNAEIPRLLDWKNSGAVPAELRVFGVATAVSKSSVNYPPAEWFSNKGWSWPVIVDESTGDGAAGKTAAAFGATGWPYIVIVGADGKVKARVSGEVEINELEAIVESALNS